MTGECLINSWKHKKSLKGTCKGVLADKFQMVIVPALGELLKTWAIVLDFPSQVTDNPTTSVAVDMLPCILSHTAWYVMPGLKGDWKIQELVVSLQVCSEPTECRMLKMRGNGKHNRAFDLQISVPFLAVWEKNDSPRHDTSGSVATDTAQHIRCHTGGARSLTGQGGLLTLVIVIFSAGSYNNETKSTFTKNSPR